MLVRYIVRRNSIQGVQYIESTVYVVPSSTAVCQRVRGPIFYIISYLDTERDIFLKYFLSRCGREGNKNTFFIFFQRERTPKKYKKKFERDRERTQKKMKKNHVSVSLTPRYFVRGGFLVVGPRKKWVVVG